MAKEIILSGMQPTGQLHLGNYLGALKNFVKIQNQGDYERCYFFIADLHSITEDFDPKIKAAQTLELAAEYLAAGLDPDKVVIFVQSQVPACTELAWIFDCQMPIAEMQRMTQFKDKALRQKQNVNLGLFAYPILQAADILLYHTTAVPVGEDQVQHVELTRQAARFFNKKFGQYFAEPKPLLTKIPRVMSLKHPDRKMSKSESDGCVFIADEPEVIATKLKKAVTTPEGLANLKILSEEFKEFMPANFSFDETNNQKNKAVLAQAIADSLVDFRAKKRELLKQPQVIVNILTAGATKAQSVAEKTMVEIKAKVGLLT
ncbi:MAG: tryptophan--tRNA ligase [Candidatus Buchananbacteria bacterium]